MTSASEPSEPTYRQSIVTFIDILGFRALVEKESEREIVEVLRLFKRHSTPDQGAATTYEVGFTHFSDSVVRTTNIMSKANAALPIGLLWNELFDLLCLQISLIERGVLIRGGVTINKVVHGDGFLFGPGMNRAYGLESKVACYPRIVLDRHVLPLMREAAALRYRDHSPRMEEEYLGEMLSVASDGHVFVDYLKGAAANAEDVASYASFLRIHRDIILARYAAETDRHVRRKVRWLAGYHNETVARMAPRLRELGVGNRGVTVPVRRVPRSRHPVLAGSRVST